MGSTLAKFLPDDNEESKRLNLLNEDDDKTLYGHHTCFKGDYKYFLAYKCQMKKNAKSIANVHDEYGRIVENRKMICDAIKKQYDRKTEELILKEEAKGLSYPQVQTLVRKYNVFSTLTFKFENDAVDISELSRVLTIGTADFMSSIGVAISELGELLKEDFKGWMMGFKGQIPVPTKMEWEKELDALGSIEENPTMDKVTVLQEELGKLQFLFHDRLGILQRDFKTHGDDVSKNFASDILDTYKSVLKLIDDLPDDDNEDLEISDETLQKIDEENRRIKQELEEKEKSMDVIRKRIGFVLEHLAEQSFSNTALSAMKDENK